MSKSSVLNLVILTGVLVGFLAVNRWSQTHRSIQRTQYTDLSYSLTRIPSPSDADQHEMTTRISDHLGKGVILNFWASWCTECAEEEDALMELAQRPDLNGYQVIGVGTFDHAENIRKAASAWEGIFPVFLDEQGLLTQYFGVDSIPQTIVIDEKGIEIFRKRGALAGDDISRLVAGLNRTQEDQIRIRQAAPLPADAAESKILPVVSELPHFQFTRSDGKKFGSDEMRGKVWVADFIFTSCQSVCPLLTKEMKRLQFELHSRSDVEFLSLSVDSKRDTPEKLQDYKKKYEVDWTFLTGGEDEVRGLIRNGFKLPASGRGLFHTNKFVLVDRDLKIRGYYASGSAMDLKRLKEDVEALR